MQKAGAVKVKQAIEALCKVLSAGGIPSVPVPEAFRRAKYNSGSEEDQFWELLVKLLQMANIVSSQTCQEHTQGGGDRRLVLVGLWQTGYQAGWMDGEGVGPGGEAWPSSRDLLLALGWLLATGALERLLARRVQQLDLTLLEPALLEPTLQGLRQSCDDCSVPRSHAVTSLMACTYADRLDASALRRLQWGVGCLRYQWQSLLSLQEERARLLHMVLSANPSSFPKKQHSPELKQDCVNLRQLSDLLVAYLSWKNVEKLFWVWMDSVAGCHMTANHEASTVHASRPAANGSKAVCRHGNRGLEKLDSMLLDLPNAPTKHRGGITTEDLNTSFSPLCSITPLPPRAYQARLQSHVDRFPGKGPRGRATSAGKPQASPTSQAQLLEGSERRRLAYRTQLQEMMGGLEELVLMPPPIRTLPSL